MKKETMRGVLLLFVCSGFWVITLALTASFFGLGFAQGPQGVPNTVPQMTGTSFGFPYINNNTTLPNQSQVTYNSATQETLVPFQLDTSRWLAFSVVVDDTVQTLTVLDPANQALAVYHIYLTGSDKGKCELMSVRNISGDLRFDVYNPMPNTPLPAQMRDVIEQKLQQ